jgi:predicted ATPase
MSKTIPINGHPASGSTAPFLKRVKIRNYKSLANCDVELGPLNVLVGRNGSGKSNFLDALSFVADALRTSLDHAIKARGGVDEVRRRSTRGPNNFALELEVNLKDGRTASYGFEIAAAKNHGFSVKWEKLQIRDKSDVMVVFYARKGGDILGSGNGDRAQSRRDPMYLWESGEAMPPVSRDRLYLVNAAGLPKFRDVYDALLTMGFYNLNPESIGSLQSPDAGEILHRDGRNMASVIGRIGRDEPEVKERIKGYLATIVPGVTDFNRVGLGPKETIEFRQEVSGSKSPWRFLASSMSDGTLRALGALVAVNQLAEGTVPVRFIGIEEPEAALHPAALAALMDALREAAEQTQVVVTTHSPDLLDLLDL